MGNGRGWCRLQYKLRRAVKEDRWLQDHVTNAKLLAANDLTGRNLPDCTMPPLRPRSP